MKIIFKLGFNIFTLFHHGNRKQSLLSIIVAIISLVILILLSILLILKSDIIATNILSYFNIINYSYRFSFEMIVMFGTLIIYILLYLLYGLSKIKYINASSINSLYVVDSITYMSNINGRVKKFLLKKQQSESFGNSEIIASPLPFRKLKIGNEVNVIYRDTSFKDLYYIEGDKKTIIYGYLLLVFIVFVLGLIYIIL